MQYTKQNYLSLLKCFREAGYQDHVFGEKFGERKSVFLRHDVDISLELALELAELEYQNGFRATYFVLLDTEFYNVLSADNRRRIIEIHQMGHEIGLHFDASSSVGQAALEVRINAECEILEGIIGSPIGVVAPHRPTADFLGSPGNICGRIHPYQPRFFLDMKYVSDSLGGWTRDHPTENETFATGRNLQILTHPYIWASLQGDNQNDRIQCILDRSRMRLERAARKNFTTYFQS